MKILVDGIFFQLAQSGISRVWSTLLTKLANKSDIEVVCLDRGGAPIIEGIRLIPFPSYTFSATAAESFLLQDICNQIGADVFASTYYTSPVETPSLMVVYDMIPEVMEFDLKHRIWMEKQVSIVHARQFVCISNSTASDLQRFYPTIDNNQIHIGYCGYDPEHFFPASQRETSEAISSKLLPSRNADRPYVLLVGSREQHKSYKNCKLFFSALKQMPVIDFDVICVGGEPDIQPDFVDGLSKMCSVDLLRVSDAELGALYRGAAALVYPSLYEGFGMPVLEAMACGCPVITSDQSSLPEVGGNAPIYISGRDVREIIQALNSVRVQEVRSTAIIKGLDQARKFSWDNFADIFIHAAKQTQKMSHKKEYIDFTKRYSQIRRIQKEVDVDVYVDM